MSYKVPQLVVHFGLPKTGTTAIQRTLFEQRAQLLKNHKTLYPGRFDRHIYLTAFFADCPESRLDIQLLGLRERAETESFLQGYWREILDEIEWNRPERVILSNEAFLDLSPKEMERMHAVLKEIAAEIVLFAYVRDPWSWAISRTLEAILTGITRREAHIEYPRNFVTKVILSFEKAFDAKAILAPYLNTSGDFNAAVDFCERFKLDSLIPAARQKSGVRTGIKREAASLLLQLNEHYPAFDDRGNFMPDAARDIMCSAIRYAPFSKGTIQLARKTAEEIYQASKADIELLEQAYFGGQDLFTQHYRSLAAAEFDDTLSVAGFGADQLSAYYLSCMHELADQLLQRGKPIVQLEQCIAEQEQQIARQEYRIAQQEHQIAQQEHQIRAMQATKAWLLATFFRDLRDSLLHRSRT